MEPWYVKIFGLKNLFLAQKLKNLKPIKGAYFIAKIKNNSIKTIIPRKNK